MISATARVIEEVVGVNRLWRLFLKSVPERIVLEPETISDEMQKIMQSVQQGEEIHKRGKIGYRVWQLRRREGLSQIELARKVNLTSRTIINIENGKYMALESLVKLTNYFQVLLRYFLTGEVHEEPWEKLDMANLGPNLRRLRSSHWLSLEEVGKLLGVNRQNIGLIESGKTHPSPDLLSEIERKFNIPVDDLLKKKEVKSLPAEVTPIKEEKVAPDEQWKILQVLDPAELGSRILNIRLRENKNQGEFMGDEYRGWLSGIERSIIKNPRIDTLVAVANTSKESLFYVLTGKKSTKPWRPLVIEAFAFNLARLKRNYSQDSPLTQKELGERVKNNQGSIGKYERGEDLPRMLAFTSLAIFFKEPVDDFFIGKESDRLDWTWSRQRTEETIEASL